MKVQKLVQIYLAAVCVMLTLKTGFMTTKVILVISRVTVVAQKWASKPSLSAKFASVVER